MNDLFSAQPAPIKALSLWQPWASLMASGLKPDETRHWSTDYRGPIAIHAAKTMDVAGAPEALCLAAFGRFWAKELPRGAVVAVGRLSSCRRAETVADRLTPANRAAGNFTPGRYAWRVEDIRAIDRPIPVIGRQGLFNWTPPSDMAARLGPILVHDAACRHIGWAA